MTGYAKQRADWQNGPAGGTPILESHLDAWETAMFELKYLTYNVKDYGAVGDGTTDDTTAIQAAIDAAGAAGSGIVAFPRGNYKVSSSLSLVGYSNIWVRGSGIDVTTVTCTSALNGSNASTKNDVFNVNNLTAPVGSYLKRIWVSDMTIDCSAQSASGVPGGASLGYNLCAVEFQNVDHARAFRLRVYKAFGNGVVSASIDPTVTGAVKGAWIVDCVFDTCVQGTLPQYGNIAGSAIQYGAMNGGVIRGNQFLNPGGPAIDVFNCTGTIIEGNYLSGASTTPIGAGQTVNSIRSDFGLVDCVIRNNVLENAGPISLLGNMTPGTFNGSVSTPGPNGCVIAGNVVKGTATNAWGSQPAIPASGSTVTNTSGFLIGVQLAGGTSVVVRVDGTIQTLTGPSNNRFLVPIGSVVQLNYATAPTWTWYIAQNINQPHLTMLAGNAGGQPLGVCSNNTIAGNNFLGSPVTAVSLYDCQYNIVQGNVISNPGDWTPSNAIDAHDTAAVSGTGTRGNLIVDNLIRDTRTTKTLQADYRDDSANCIDNVMMHNRVEAAVIGTYVLTTAATSFYARGNHGPGRTAQPLTPPAVPASNTVLTNPFSHDVVVHLTGGTVTVVKCSGTTTGLTAGTFKLRFGDTITLTYSVAPTWTWFIAD